MSGNKYLVITNGRAALGRSSSTRGKSEHERPAGQPWSRFWEDYISATTGPIAWPSSVLDSPIPPTTNGTDADLST